MSTFSGGETLSRVIRGVGYTSNGTVGVGVYSVPAGVYAEAFLFGVSCVNNPGLAGFSIGVYSAFSTGGVGSDRLTYISDSISTAIINSQFASLSFYRAESTNTPIDPTLAKNLVQPTMALLSAGDQVVLFASAAGRSGVIDILIKEYVAPGGLITL